MPEGDGLDAYSGISDVATASDATVHADAIGVLAQGLKCDKFQPEELGISPETAAQVKFALKGDGCPPFYMAPELTEGCAVPDVVPAESYGKFDGTLFVMENDGGYDLQSGQMVIHEFEGICGKFPNTTIKALGIEMKPINESEAKIQARIETGDVGDLLLRVHIWTGDAKVISIEGDQFIELTQGMQVLLDQNFNILEAMQTQVQETSIPIDAEGESEQTSASQEVPSGGCDASGQPLSPHQLDALMVLIAIMALGRAVKAQVGSAFSWGGAMSLLEKMGNRPTDKR